MTIHKSKGLEFEVVIVPDLQAAGSAGSRKMLSWLERGLPRFDDSGESTEFLIAPLQRKGDERGTTKQWVDRIYRERESQEMRRILYVAATRAREELHFFARPGYKTEADGSLSLPTPSNSLLATAWPALEEEVRACFEEWKTSDAGQEQVLDSIAASVQSNVLAMPAPAKPTLLRRLPSNYHTAQSNRNSPLLAGPGPLALSQSCHPEPSAAEAMDLHLPFVETQSLRSPGAPEPVLSLSRNLASETWESRFYDRHEGGALSRALGAAVHSFLEQLSRLRNPHDWQSVREELSRLQPRIVAQIRAVGIDPAQSAQIASQALEQALNAANDPIGKWILSPHANADSEVSWTGVVRGRLRTVRVDRVFRAGNMPLSDGEKCWWVVDYKTAHADDPNLDPAAELAKLRPVFAPQLEAYADLLRKLHGADAPIHAGLYYPRMLLFDWWEA
jgi:ATP-dependent exoDNAse (exonuclease V) beta subunit